MKVLGYHGGIDGYAAVSGAGHDAAAAIVVDGEIVAACEEARFVGQPHTRALPVNAIAFCLRAAGVRDASDLDAVSPAFSLPLMHHPRQYSENAWRLPRVVRPLARLAIGGARLAHHLAGYDHARSRRAFETGVGAALREGQFAPVPHPIAHAANAFYTSSFPRALCATFDSDGECATSLLAVASESGLRVLRQAYEPNSLGGLAALLARFLGIERHEEHTIADLATYGDPARYAPFFARAVRLLPEGRYAIDPALVLVLRLRDAMFGDRPWAYPRSLVHALGTPRTRGDTPSQRHHDIAAALQAVLEKIVLHVLAHARHATGEPHLCLSGAVARNGRLNAAVARSGLFDAVWIPPATHGPGAAVGAALQVFRERAQRRPEPRERVHLGPGYDARVARTALRGRAGELRFRRPGNWVDTVAEALASGRIVGWFQGTSEWGAESYGNRCVLADPRREDVVHAIRHALDVRGAIAPLVPVCLAEDAPGWFDLSAVGESPFAHFAVAIHAERRTEIPGVATADGTARVQTLLQPDNPPLHALITAFARRTGVPLLVRADFATAHGPTVQSADDAIACFFASGIDLLVMGDVLVEKRVDASGSAETPRGGRATRPDEQVARQVSLV